MSQVEKVAIIGLDCADPKLVFERWLDDLPNLRRLAEVGLHGELESCMPPVTVPAWSCMASSKDPGALGVYGFQNRRDWSYENPSLASNLDVRQPRLWDHLARADQPSILIGVPQTFPIVRPPLGHLITGFLTPSIKSPYTHPPELADEVAGLVGEYLLDVADFRTTNKAWLLDRLYRLAEQRFTVARHLATTKPWTLLWLVEMSIDRLHHGFWHLMDPEHRRHPPDSALESAIHDFYVFIDRQIGGLLDVLDLNRTAVWVVSDHGAQRLDGTFCINDWLIHEGLLTMKTPVTQRRRFELADVDWSRTKVWADGGYYGRLFINGAEREPLGIVAQADYQTLRNELVEKIEALPDHRGRPMGNRVYKPEHLYEGLRGVPPDLLVYFGNLRWRATASVGNAELHVFDDDIGPDAANHALQGLYILSHPSVPTDRQDATLYDVLPTTLHLLGIRVPQGLRGVSLLLR